MFFFTFLGFSLNPTLAQLFFRKKYPLKSGPNYPVSQLCICFCKFFLAKLSRSRVLTFLVKKTKGKTT